MAEGKGVALAILGIVAVIAVVGLVLLFSGATAKVASSSYNAMNLYGGNLNRGPEGETGFVRYSTNRATQGRLYSDQWSDDFRDRNQDTGTMEAPRALYNQDYKRTGPVLPDKCPSEYFGEYRDPVTSLYAWDACVQSPVDPAFYCCPAGNAPAYG